jgi:hypothetical protein
MEVLLVIFEVLTIVLEKFEKPKRFPELLFISKNHIHTLWVAIWFLKLAIVRAIV